MSSPLVSIVVPVYNGEKYILECIKSIRNQSYKNIELIIVNDGSTDGSINLINKISWNYKLINQKNLGQSSALNNGWSESKGELIGYLSCDDTLEPNCISELVSAFDIDSDILYSNYHIINECGKRVSLVELGEFSYKGLCEDLICYPGPGTLFKKDVFKELKGWNLSLTQVPDFDFWLRASIKYKFKRIPKTLANFRLHRDSGSIKKINYKKSNEIINVVEEFYRNKISLDQKKARINAIKIAIYHHLKSKRFTTIIFYLVKSFIISPSKFLKIYSRILLNKLVVF